MIGNLRQMVIGRIMVFIQAGISVGAVRAAAERVEEALARSLSVAIGLWPHDRPEVDRYPDTQCHSSHQQIEGPGSPGDRDVREKRQPSSAQYAAILFSSL